MLTTIMLLAWSAACVADDVVPVHEEPFHRPVANTSTYRVLDVSIPPGETTLYHTHAQPTLYVTLQRTPVRAQRLDEDWGEIGTADWQPGHVVYDGAAVDAPFTHRVENQGDEHFRLTLIANHRRTSKNVAVLTESLTGELGVDNQFFVQSRIDIEPGEIVDFDSVDDELIFVSATDAVVRIDRKGNPTDGAAAFSVSQLGDVETLHAGGGLLFENVGDTSAIIIAVAVR